MKNFIIHLLGGYTKEDLALSTGDVSKDDIINEMRKCYGMHSDEWAKHMWNYLNG